MGFFGLFEKKRTVFEPGEPVEIKRRSRVRVWDIFVQGAPKNALKAQGDGAEITAGFDELPVDLGRYTISRHGERSIVVEVRPAPDEAFFGGRPKWESISATPLTSFEFTGVALSGPKTVSYSRTMGGDSWNSQQVPQFVVAGYHCFTAPQLRALTDEPNRAIHLVIGNLSTGAVDRLSVRSIADVYEYEVVGINRSPAPEPPWVGPPDDPNFVSTGGYFNSPLGLYAPDPAGTPYELRVHAECGEHRSETLTIRIED